MEEWREREGKGKEGEGRMYPEGELRKNPKRGQRDGRNTIRDWFVGSLSKKFQEEVITMSNAA